MLEKLAPHQPILDGFESDLTWHFPQYSISSPYLTATNRPAIGAITASAVALLARWNWAWVRSNIRATQLSDSIQKRRTMETSYSPLSPLPKKGRAVQRHLPTYTWVVNQWARSTFCGGTHAALRIGIRCALPHGNPPHDQLAQSGTEKAVDSRLPRPNGPICRRHLATLFRNFLRQQLQLKSNFFLRPISPLPMGKIPNHIRR